MHFVSPSMVASRNGMSEDSEAEMKLYPNMSVQNIIYLSFCI